MNVEIRPAAQEEMHEFARVSATGLGIAIERIGLENPEQTLCAFERGKIVSTYRAIPFTVYCNGTNVQAAGIADVATLPTHRRKGYARRIVTHHLNEMYEKGEQPLAILWPSRGGIYRRYGYEFVTTQIKYRIAPADIRFFDGVPSVGELRELKEQHAGTLADLYHRFACERTGYLHRGDEFWQKLAAKRGADSLKTGALYFESDEPAGYVLYDVEPLQGGIFHHQHQLTVREIVYRNLSAFYAMWSFLSGLDLANSIILPSTSTDDPLPYLLAEPRALVRMETESSTTALMARIVDIAQALPRRGYGSEGRLLFEIQDELCPWNRGRWQMEVSGGKAVVKRTQKSPQLSMPVDTLAALMFNYVNASFAGRLNRLDVLDPSALPVWDMVMDTRHKPFCPDHF